MKTIILLLFPTIFLHGQTKNIVGHYVGGHYETFFQYKFFENGTFWSLTWGHFGYTRSSGNYSYNADTVTLNSIPTDTISKDRFLKIKNKKFLIDGDSCIIDMIGYDYCKGQYIKTDSSLTLGGSKKRFRITFDRSKSFEILSCKRNRSLGYPPKDTSSCINWFVTKDAVKDLILNGVPIEKTIWKEKFIDSPCYYEGWIEQNRRKFNYTINAGYWIRINGIDTDIRYVFYNVKFDKYFISKYAQTK